MSKAIEDLKLRADDWSKDHRQVLMDAIGLAEKLDALVRELVEELDHDGDSGHYCRICKLLDRAKEVAGE